MGRVHCSDGGDKRINLNLFVHYIDGILKASNFIDLIMMDDRVDH